MKKQVSGEPSFLLREISGLILLVLAIFLAIAFYFPGTRTGVLGSFLLRCTRGVCGPLAFGIPPLLTYTALEVWFANRRLVSHTRILHVLVLSLFLAAIFHLATVPDDRLRALCVNSQGVQTGTQFLSKLVQISANPDAYPPLAGSLPGGLLGGLLAMGLATITGKTGAYLFLALAALIELVLIFNLSISHAIRVTSSVLREGGERVMHEVRRASANSRVQSTRPLTQVIPPPELPGEQMRLPFEPIQSEILQETPHSTPLSLGSPNAAAADTALPILPWGESTETAADSLSYSQISSAGGSSAPLPDPFTPSIPPETRGLQPPPQTGSNTLSTLPEAKENWRIPSFLRHPFEEDAGLAPRTPQGIAGLGGDSIIPPELPQANRIGMDPLVNEGERPALKLPEVNLLIDDQNADGVLGNPNPSPSDTIRHPVSIDKILSDQEVDHTFVGHQDTEWRAGEEELFPPPIRIGEEPAWIPAPSTEDLRSASPEEKESCSCEPLLNEEPVAQLPILTAEKTSLKKSALAGSAVEEPLQSLSNQGEVRCNSADENAPTDFEIVGPDEAAAKAEAEPIADEDAISTPASLRLAAASGDKKLSPALHLVNPPPYRFPPLDLLQPEPPVQTGTRSEKIRVLAQRLEQTLQTFNVEAKVIQVTHGPTITRFELSPSPGVKVSKILNLSDDIALSLAALSVRIEAPIPGKSAIGIEIPNEERHLVGLRELLSEKRFQDSRAPLLVALGRDIPGQPVLCDLAKMPHLLIAGATGSGKSVCINCILLSLLYHAHPDEVKLLMIDPKVVELKIFNGIPHLLAPVVTDPKKAANTLNWAVNEMDRRYRLFSDVNVRDYSGYQEAALRDDLERLPLILIVIDELADLMATCAKEIEESIARLAAMARAAGIHLLIATQRPSVDVITGVIKSNIPSRIAFSVSSQVDSRTILDGVGAEKLLGRGDMLYSPLSETKSIRAQGAFVSDNEVESVISFLKAQNYEGYDAVIQKQIETTSASTQAADRAQEAEDELLDQGVGVALDAGYASVSLMQRRLNLGYPRAARLIDSMEAAGFIGPFEGSKPRTLRITRAQWEAAKREGENHD